MKRHASESLFTYIARCFCVFALLGMPLWFAIAETWAYGMAHYEVYERHHGVGEYWAKFAISLQSPGTWICATPAMLSGLWLWFQPLMKRHVSESLFIYIFRCLWVITLLGTPLWSAIEKTKLSSMAHYESMGWYYGFDEGWVVLSMSLISPLTWTGAAPPVLIGLWLWFHPFSVINMVVQIFILFIFYLLPVLIFSGWT